MRFGENLKSARLRAGLTQLQIAEALGVTASTYCGYETGKRQPDLSRLRRLAQLLHVSADALLSLPSNSPEIQNAPVRSVTKAEYEGLERFRSLDAHGQRVVRLVAEEELARLHSAASRAPERISFRISEQPAAAGLGVYLGPDAFRDVSVRRGALPRGASFGVPVSGDSMEPAYHDGDILIVSDALPEPGEVGVFVMDGMGYVKLCGRGELLSLNPAYAPISMTEGIRPCGKVIGTLDPRLISPA